MGNLNLVSNFITNFETKFKSKIEIPSYSEIYFKDKIISSSLNQVEEKQNRTKHSEIICIENSEKILDQKFLFNTTMITLIEPCTMCAGAIIQARISKVIYLLESKKIPGISSLSFESIYQKNHFPKLEFQYSEKLEKFVKNFFKELR